MTSTKEAFLRNSEIKATDKELKRKLRFNISKYEETVVKGKQQYSDLESAKKKAKNIKWKAIAGLEKYLVQFEKNFTKRGGKVIWAQDADGAIAEIIKIVNRAGAKSVVKAKSMITEEIELNHHLEKEGVKVYETDLGEFIVQMAGEKPYHIVTPAMHKSKEDVAALFHEHLNTPPDSTPTELTYVARNELREKYLSSAIGISGVNFLLPDVGGIAITENEGNARLSLAFPKIHIAIAGIEKVIPYMSDLSHFWPLLATYGTGQKVTVYNSILSGPRQENETDGPEEMYVILLDNGRTNLLAETQQREALYCIRCGACLNACPVYKNIGGHAYGTTYSGPIGSIITPHFRGQKEFQHLSYASTLCGNCTEVCPVRIDLHKLLLYNRRDFVKKGLNESEEKWGFRLWKTGVKSRMMMNSPGSRIKNFIFRYLFKESWGKRRDVLYFPDKSFNKLWQERFGDK